MAVAQATKLIRKQFLISSSQVKKIDRLAKKQNTSSAEMVRKAIDAFNPDVPANMEESELLELASSRVKEAIARTQKANKVVAKVLKEMEERNR